MLFRRKPWVALAVGTAAVMVSAAPAGASAASGHATAFAPTQHAATATATATASAPVSLSGWNLVIPVDSSGGTTGDATTISPATTHPPYLTQDSGGALHFWAPSDGALLGISLHARTELRGPGTFVLGQSPAGLVETTAVTQLPDSSHDIIIGQMFPTGTTPFAMLHYQSGKVYGFVHGQSSQYVLMTGIPLGATFQDSITAVGNTVTFSVTYNGQTASQAVVGDSSWIGDTMHFQAGDYQQDLQNSPSTDGGAVTFSGLCQYGVPGGAATAAGCAASDFSLAASPSSGSVTAGSSATATVSTAVTSGSAESVALSASGLPAGATASFSPASVNSGTSSTLTIATSSSTPAGTYPITVTGSAASGSHATPYTLTVTAPAACTPAQLLVNPGFESGDTGWTTSSTLGLDPITNDSSEPAHSGAYKAWLNGNGTADTDVLEQTVTIPTGCTATFSYWQHIDTTENTSSAKPDTLKVQVLTSTGTYLATLATYSNLDANTGYAQKTFNLSSYAGQSIKVKWIGAETDGNGGTTDFVIDDTGLATS